MPGVFHEPREIIEIQLHQQAGTQFFKQFQMDFAMYNAIQNNEPDKLRAVLQRGGDVNAWMEDPVRISGKSLLHVCCEKGRFQCAEVLIEFGVQIDSQGSWGHSPLMICIITEYLDLAELLLQNSPVNIIDMKDTYGNSPLHMAIENDSVESVQLLLKYECDVNICNNHGVTPLMAVCAMKTSEHAAEIVSLLLDAGADPNETDFRSRRTALHQAAVAKNIETVQLLLSAGAHVSCLDNGGKTPLTSIIWDYVRSYPNTGTIHPDVWTIIDLLIKAGTDLDNCSRENSNPLVMATSFKCASLVKYLLEHGASMKLKFFAGMTPLLVAVSKNCMECVKLLLDWGCDMYVKGRIMRRNYDFYRDAFELAMELEFPDIVCLLAGCGYNISRVDYLVHWVMDPPVCLQKHPEVLEYLRLNAVLPPTLFRCAVLSIRKALDTNISKKADSLPLPKFLIESVQLKDIFTENG